MKTDKLTRLEKVLIDGFKAGHISGTELPALIGVLKHTNLKDPYVVRQVGTLSIAIIEEMRKPEHDIFNSVELPDLSAREDLGYTG